MSKYKVGDRALVIDKEKAILFGGTNRITPSMMQYCGKWLTIRSVGSIMGVPVYGVEENEYAWMKSHFQEPLFKVGDMVKIKRKEWFDENKSPGGFIHTPRRAGFNLQMEEYLGKEAVITEIFGVHKVYRIDIDDGDNVWEDAMFETPEETISESSSKYKVGDKIIIKSIYWYEANKDKNGEVKSNNPYVTFVPSMKSTCSEELTIRYVFKDFYIVEENYWAYNDDFIDSSVEERKSSMPDSINSLYKVGWTVRVKDYIPELYNEDEPMECNLIHGWDRDMDTYAGKEVTIAKVYGSCLYPGHHTYKLEEDGGVFYWEESMFE